MPVIILLILLVLIGVGVFIKIKINKAVYRGRQATLNKFGLGNANIGSAVNKMEEKVALNNLLADNPNLTEQIIKDTVFNYSQMILNRQNNGMFSEKVLNNVMNDKLIDTVRNMQFKRVNIIFYSNKMFEAMVVYTDQRDEYEMLVFANIRENGIVVDNYSLRKGDVVGL